MPPLSIAPIINQLKESIEDAEDVRALRDSFRRIIEAFEEVEMVYNETYNNPQNLNFGFLTHRLERPEDLPNYLRLIAGDGIALTKDLTGKTMAVSLPVVTIALAPGAPGNFTIAHGAGAIPLLVILEETVGAFWFQSPTAYDATNLYLVASDALATGQAKVVAK